MTDLEILKNLYNRAKVLYEVKEREDAFIISTREGYPGFYNDHYFTKDGELVYVGAYEE